jgi:hypothetical protein
MDEKTLEALRGSIRKWESIAAGIGVDAGSTNCPLCHLFVDGDCYGCPASKWGDCIDTPFEEFGDHVWHEHGQSTFPIQPYCPECRRLAQKEVDYLRSLLPNG